MNGNQFPGYIFSKPSPPYESQYDEEVNYVQWNQLFDKNVKHMSVATDELQLIVT